MNLHYNGFWLVGLLRGPVSGIPWDAVLSGSVRAAVRGWHRKSQRFAGVDIVNGGNKKDFCRYTGSKRRTKGNMGPLKKVARDLTAKDTEKTEIIQLLLCFVFIG